MPHLLIKVASLVSYVILLVRLHLYYDPHLSLSTCIHFFIKLALLATYITMISRSICGLGCVSLNLYMRIYILFTI
jgi:hypothetical protein